MSICLIFSKFNVTIIPINEPIKLPATPIKDPMIINILKIEISDVPIVLRIAISFDLFLTGIKFGFIKIHSFFMIGTYIGLFIAGIFTLMPGRYIANFFGI